MYLLICLLIRIVINYLFDLFLHIYLFGLSIIQPVRQLLSESISEKYLHFCFFTYMFTYWYTFYLILKYSTPCIFVYVTSLQLHQLNTHFLFVTHLYCVSPTCFGVSHTIFRENFRVPYSKPPACTEASICGAVVAS